MDACFDRTIRIVGAAAVEHFRAARVAVFGIGGVGGHTVEALARVGVGCFLLIDADCVAESNLNRQMVALRSTIGRPKVDVMAERIRDINPETTVETRHIFYDTSTADTFNLASFTVIVDAIDSVKAKTELLVRAKNAGVPVVSCMGAGNKLDPTRFEIADLAETSVCPLCKVMRKNLRARGVEHVTVVYSREPAVRPAGPTEDGAPGSLAYVTAAAGLALAAATVREIMRVSGE